MHVLKLVEIMTVKLNRLRRLDRKVSCSRQFVSAWGQNSSWSLDGKVNHSRFGWTSGQTSQALKTHSMAIINKQILMQPGGQTQQCHIQRGAHKTAVSIHISLYTILNIVIQNHNYAIPIWARSPSRTAGLGWLQEKLNSMARVKCPRLLNFVWTPKAKTQSQVVKTWCQDHPVLWLNLGQTSSQALKTWWQGQVGWMIKLWQGQLLQALNL